jgi:hypothetical protein
MVAPGLGGAPPHHGEAVPQQQSERRDHQPKPGAEQSDHRQRDQHHGNRKPGRDREQHHIVDAPAEEAADHAERDADHARRDHRHDADQERDARAVDEPRQIVAAELVGAERMRGLRPLHPEWRNEPIAEILREGIRGHEGIAEQRSGGDHADDRKPDREAGGADARGL